MSLTSVSEVKLIMGISGSAYDNQISALLPIVESHIQHECNYDFVSSSIGWDSYGNVGYSSSLEVVYPDGLKLVAAQMIEYLIYKSKTGNITSENIGSYGVSYANTFPDDLKEALKPYRHVRVK